MSASQKPILLFDWDGTVVDSNTFKWGEAWQKVFADNEEAKKAIVEVLNRPNGKLYNRWELIRETFALLGNEDVVSLEGEDLQQHPLVAAYADTFSDVLRQGILDMKPFDGAQEVIAELAHRGYVMYVITNSLAAGVHDQIKHFNLHGFKDVYGLPNTKYENFLEIAAREGVDDPHMYVCIGDGDHDKNLAEKIGCRFIGIANESNKWGNVDSFVTLATICDVVGIL